VLDVLLVHEGIDAGREHVEKVASLVESLARGKRFLPIWEVVELDVDAFIDKAKKEPTHPDEADEQLARSFAAYQENLTVVEARVLLDEEEGGRLCLVQHARFARASRFMALLSEAMNALQIEGMSDGNKDTSGDPATDALQLARARAGGSWASFEGATLDVSVPMTREFAAGLLKKWLGDAEAPHPDDRVTRRLLASLSAFEVSRDELRLHFAPDDDGWIHFRFPESEGYDKGVAEQLGRQTPLAKAKLSAEIERLKSK